MHNETKGKMLMLAVVLGMIGMLWVFITLLVRYGPVMQEDNRRQYVETAVHCKASCEAADAGADFWMLVPYTGGPACVCGGATRGVVYIEASSPTIAPLPDAGD